MSVDRRRRVYPRRPGEIAGLRICWRANDAERRRIRRQDKQLLLLMGGSRGMFRYTRWEIRRRVNKSR